jgi:hypothetical protein
MGERREILHSYRILITYFITKLDFKIYITILCAVDVFWLVKIKWDQNEFHHEYVFCAQKKKKKFISVLLYEVCINIVQKTLFFFIKLSKILKLRTKC